MTTSQSAWDTVDDCDPMETTVEQMRNVSKFRTPLDAVWHQKEIDIPVVVTGAIIVESGDFYYAIEGSETLLPHKALKFKPGEDPLTGC